MQYEYKFILVYAGQGRFEETATELGLEGWFLVTITPLEQDGFPVAIFQRVI